MNSASAHAFAAVKLLEQASFSGKKLLRGILTASLSLKGLSTRIRKTERATVAYCVCLKAGICITGLAWLKAVKGRKMDAERGIIQLLNSNCIPFTERVVQGPK